MTSPSSTISGQRIPTFFIVGAPKSGTSAMHDFLRQHPDIFMPPFKEIHYFGSDLTFPGRLDRTEYLKCFSDWGNERIAGETSVYYLASKRAAAEIHAFNPVARVIIMLRNPVEAIGSLYHQVRFNLNEPLDSLEAALAAEPRRAQGLDLPPSTAKPHQLLYRGTVSYHDQVARYLDTFGPGSVHVILYDDFRCDLASTYRATLEFLGVDTTFEPQFSVINPNKVYRSELLQSFLNRPPAWLADVVRRVVPFRVVRRLVARGHSLNTRPVAREPMNRELRQRLSDELAPDIARLAALLGRDLRMWSAAAAPPDQPDP
jgi:Sulfotransferase domain